MAIGLIATKSSAMASDTGGIGVPSDKEVATMIQRAEQDAIYPALGRTAAVAVAGIALLLALPACGTPTEPEAQAMLAARGALNFACGIECEYEGEAHNAGAGCARSVHGLTRIFDGDGNEIGRDDWTLDPARRVRPDEAFLYRGCCFSVADSNAMRSYETEIVWDDVSC